MSNRCAQCVNRDGNNVVIVPQHYPLWVTYCHVNENYHSYRARSYTELTIFVDEITENMQDWLSGPYLVVLWEHAPNHIPTPICANVGASEGYPCFALSPDASLSAALDTLEHTQTVARRVLKEHNDHNTAR